jgi:hypothetical protein
MDLGDYLQPWHGDQDGERELFEEYQNGTKRDEWTCLEAKQSSRKTDEELRMQISPRDIVVLDSYFVTIYTVQYVNPCNLNL